MGLASWAGPGSADGDAFERLVSAFDTLDGSDAFVHPDAMAAVAASDKESERAALDEVVAVVSEAVRRLDSRSGARRRHRAVRQDRRGLVFGRHRSADPRHRTRRRADPHRIDVESDGGTRLGDGRPSRTPGRTRRRHRRRQRAGAAMRAGKHTAGTAFDHVADGAHAGRPRYRRCHVPGARGLDDRDTASAAEHVGRARSRVLGSGPLEPIPARRCG